MGVGAIAECGFVVHHNVDPTSSEKVFHETRGQARDADRVRPRAGKFGSGPDRSREGVASRIQTGGLGIVLLARVSESLPPPPEQDRLASHKPTLARLPVPGRLKTK
jgi:hypothetical protein